MNDALVLALSLCCVYCSTGIFLYGIVYIAEKYDQDIVSQVTISNAINNKTYIT
jgi:hypothetical protein